MRFGHVYTIPAERSFVDALADGILAEWGDDPLSLADGLVLLPTRRACRALREAFLRRANGRAMLLPRLRPIGDIDEDALALSDFSDSSVASPDLASVLASLPPPIGDLRRRLILTELILKGGRGFENPTPDQASLLAADLGRFLDQVQIEGLSLDNLDALVPEEFSENWQRILGFLEIIRTHWPKILEAEMAQDPGEWQTALRHLQIEAWRATPPSYPIIAAGSTGSVPSTADLLSLVMTLPKGLVVLPGLDRELDDAAWEAVQADQTHPQYGLANLLKRFKRTRPQVLEWTTSSAEEPENRQRLSILSEAMRPAKASDRWQHLAADDARRVSGVSLLTCPNQHMESTVIALIMRQALETPTRRAALVTPDRALARRVAGELERWGLTVDDSAGSPLSDAPCTVYMRLMIEAVAKGLSPVALLSLLKHPLAAGGGKVGEFRSVVRQLERFVLRGPKPAEGFDGLYAALSGAAMSGEGMAASVAAFLEKIERALQPVIQAMLRPEVSLVDLIEAHTGVAEALAATDDTVGADRLWDGEDGEALARFIRELSDSAADGISTIHPKFYPALFDSLLVGRVVRPRFGVHPRLSIWGPLEARLQHAEVMILGGLNEGVWPPDTQADAWMSRPMRQRFGLPAPERRIGLSAHDFSQVFGAPTVYLTRSEKTDGQPTVPSRWISRLNVVLDATGQSDALDTTEPWLQWADEVGRTGLPAQPCSPPMPMPPVSARPVALSVTRVELLMRDPYSIYARYILGLKLLDPLEADPGAAERGTFIHQALEEFIRAYPNGPLPEDAFRQLAAFGSEAFGPTLSRPAVRAFWWPRFERVANWFLEQERARRESTIDSAVEVRGGIRLGRFTVRATADRIDRVANGNLVIIDYKTGSLPTKKSIEAGYSPQLPLEAAIAMDQETGFENIAAAPVDGFAYWQVSGGDPPGKIQLYEADIVETLASEARDGALQLFQAFDDPETPYLAVPRQANAPRFNDYTLLSRIDEWSVTEGPSE